MFIKFDTDKSGYLSVNELNDAITLYLNGIDKILIKQLVQKYDVDGDGAISIDEFCQFILSRNATHDDDVLRVDHLHITKPKQNNKSNKQTSINNNDSVAAATTAVRDNREEDNNKEEVLYQVKVCLKNIKSVILKEVCSSG